jgi:hypothetical protein
MWATLVSYSQCVKFRHMEIFYVGDRMTIAVTLDPENIEFRNMGC